MLFLVDRLKNTKNVGFFFEKFQLEGTEGN